MMRIDRRWLAVAGLLVMGLTAATRGDDLRHAMEVLEQLDTVRIEADYQNVPLEEVLADLGRAAGVPMRGEWDALLGLGVREQQAVTLTVGRAPATTVLAGLVLVLGDEFSRPVWEIAAGQVVITTVEATVAMRVTDVYDVRDLLRNDETVRALRGDDGRGAADGGDADADAPEIEDDVRPSSPGAELLYMIIDHVDPEAWIEYGGSRGRISERNGVLMVSATPTTHRRLRNALARLRSAVPSNLGVKLAVVELPESLLRRLQRQHGAASRALAAAVMRQSGASTIWRSGGVLGFDAALKLESAAAAAIVEVSLTARRADAPAVTLQVHARTTAGDDVRIAETTVTIAPRREAVTIELPAATPGEMRRLLAITLDPQ